LESRITARLDPKICLPAVAQGVIGIECRRADSRTLAWVTVLNHQGTRIAMDAERAFAHRLGGSCQSPIAAHARLDGQHLRLDGLVAEPDGSRLLRDTASGAIDDPAALGALLAERMLAAGAGPLLERLRAG
jgi:hydroxymethylbilane synthase